MQFLVKFKNRQLLYYYVLFLFIIGSCTYGRGGNDTPDDAEMEEIDEEKEKDENFVDETVKDNSVSDLEMNDESFDEFMDMADEFFFDNDDMTDEDISDLPDLNGSWVKLMIFRGTAKPFLISKCNAWAIMVEKVTFTQNEHVVESLNEMCRLKVGNDTFPKIYSLVPDSYAQSLDIVEKINYLSKNEDGEIFFHQPKAWDVRACHLDDPENDPLPTDVNSENVFDPDNTGINGLLIYAKGTVNGEAEIVQKVSTILNGKFDENGEIRGVTTWYEDQKVLWTGNPLMSNGAPTSPDPEIGEAESYFIFKRIAPELDCDWIRENSAVLFEEAAKVYPDEFK
ncbi:MAG TPA: hypothetical protein PLW37_04705 [bacterium]|nr:hypothetical protein [bacterium]